MFHSPSWHQTNLHPTIFLKKLLPKSSKTNRHFLPPSPYHSGAKNNPSVSYLSGIGCAWCCCFFVVGIGCAWCRCFFVVGCSDALEHPAFPKGRNAISKRRCPGYLVPSSLVRLSLFVIIDKFIFFPFLNKT